jgi:hypothetical protein
VRRAGGGCGVGAWGFDSARYARYAQPERGGRAAVCGIRGRAAVCGASTPLATLATLSLNGGARRGVRDTGARRGGGGGGDGRHAAARMRARAEMGVVR